MASGKPAAGAGSGVSTEIDIVKYIVKDLIESYSKDQSKQDVDSANLQEQKKSVFKLYMRIWITAARHVRTQCEKNEGKAVELKHVGLFFKRKDQNKYGYVPNSELLEDGRLHLADINYENYPTLPADIAENSDSKILPLNLHTISSICECKTDLVVTFLNRFRQVTVDMLQTKGVNQLQINLRFGAITISRLSGEIEFKTSAGNDGRGMDRAGLTNQKLSQLADGSRPGGEKSVSQYSYYSRPALSQTKSTLESNIRSFQNLQATSGGNGKGYINASYQPSQHGGVSQAGSSMPHLNNRSASTKAADIFSTIQPNRNNDSQSVLEAKQNNGASHSHLKNFLQSQQQSLYQQKSRDTFSQASNPNKFSHQYIQQIADLKRANVNQNVIKDQVNNYSKLNVDKWRGKANSTADGIKKRSSPENFNLKLESTQNLTAEKQSASGIGIQNQNPALSQTQNSQYYKQDSGSQVGETRNYKSEWKVSNTLGNAASSALNMAKPKDHKEMSPNYYKEIPAFLRSEGPYTVYNHHKMKGEEYYDNHKLTKSNAKKRVHDQLEQLRLEKEVQKQQFQNQIATEEETFQIQQQLKRIQQLENQQYVKMQMEQRQKKREYEENDTKNFNTKAHFGPEESEEVAQTITQKHAEQKARIREQYLHQIQLQHLDRKLEKEIEKTKDSKNIETIIEFQNSEEEAKKLKNLQNQQKLKKAWLEQIQVKQIKQNYERIFD